MLALVRVGHQHLDVLAQHLFLAVAKYRFGGIVEREDAAFRIDGDNSVGGAINNGGQTPFARSLRWSWTKRFCCDVD